MFEHLTEQMAKQQGMTKALKASDMMVWVWRMNNIHNAVSEIIRTKIIYA